MPLATMDTLVKSVDEAHTSGNLDILVESVDEPHAIGNHGYPCKKCRCDKPHTSGNHG